MPANFRVYVPTKSHIVLSLSALFALVGVLWGCAGVVRSQAVSTTPTPLSITTTSLPAAGLGSSYSAALAVSGGTAPYFWSVSSGALPAGLALSAAGGQIAGTPTQDGNASFKVQVSDSSATPLTAAQSLTLTVSSAPVALSITTTSLPGGTAGAAYSATLAASGGKSPYTWSISAGALPRGLSLAASTGAISGTPAVAGTFSFTVSASDSTTPTAQGATKALGLTVSAAGTPLSISTSSLSSATQGTAYSATLAANGGTTSYSWSVTSGALPSGMILSSAGQISGTPTASGNFTFTVQVTDSTMPTAQRATKSLSLAVALAFAITTSSLPPGQEGAVYSTGLAASGGSSPYSWSMTSGSLPPGLSLSASGVISGTPTSSGTYPCTVRVADSSSSAKTASKNLSISIAATAALQISSTTLPRGEVSSSYAVALHAAGGIAPYTWKITNGSLPAGLSLAASTGLISGTPTSSGSSTFTAQVSDSSNPTPQTALSQSLTLTVSPATGPSPLTLSVVTTVQPALQGQQYNPATGSGNGGAVLNISGGTAPYSCWVSSGSIPPGMSLSEVRPTVTPAGLCVLTGTPTSAGDFSFTVQVTDSASNTSSQSVRFIVGASSTPAISGVTATQTSSTSETITWTTSVPADSLVYYGPTDDYEVASPVTDTTGVTSHSVVLTGLLPGQQYSFGVRSRGIAGGLGQIYLATFQSGFSFNVASGSTTGTLDFVFSLQGGHNVVQGYPLYIGISPYLTGGTSSYQNNSLKFQITHIPPNTQVHWPDQQDNGYGGNACTVRTTTTTNDSMTCYAPTEGTQFDLLTNVGGTTPVGSYTLTVAVSINGGALSHSRTYPVNVVAIPSFSSGSPSNQPPIPSLALWQANMLTYGAKWSTGCPAGFDQGVSYYDGIWVYQRVAAYTNNLTTWGPAKTALISCYRDGYVLPNSGGVPGYWVFPHGLYNDCVNNGVAASCTALHDLATNAAGANMLNGGYVASTRVREGCYMLGAKRLDYDAGGASTLAQVKQMAAYCLGDEDQIVNNNAYFPFENFFMDGLMAQALIEYWEDPKTGNGDPRIPPAIKAIADHVWSVGWIPWSGGNGEFVYNLFQNQIGLGVGQMESLNLLIAPMFAWLYENTGLSEYQLEGDTIWSAGVNDPPSDGIGWSGKNFSQQYRWSFDYVTWRTLH